jgi:hypothetical protein
MVAIVALIALMPVGFKISALALSGVVGLIVVNPCCGVDALAIRGYVRLPGRSST